KQIGYPLSVFDIGLSAGYRLYVLGIEQPYLKGGFKQVVDRLPVGAGGFHCDVSNLGGTEPIVQGKQRLWSGAEGLGLPLHNSLRRVSRAADATSHDAALVNVQSSTLSVYHVHRVHVSVDCLLSRRLESAIGRMPSMSDSDIR